jgi:hypothetical protein
MGRGENETPFSRLSSIFGGVDIRAVTNFTRHLPTVWRATPPVDPKWGQNPAIA